MTAQTETEKQRLDLFAAAALTGLLASGQFTEPTEDGPWAILIENKFYEEEKEHDPENARRYYTTAPELAWAFARWMLRDQPKTQPIEEPCQTLV